MFNEKATYERISGTYDLFRKDGNLPRLAALSGRWTPRFATVTI
jgi:hypothetical protein